MNSVNKLYEMKQQGYTADELREVFREAISEARQGKPQAKPEFFLEVTTPANETVRIPVSESEAYQAQYLIDQSGHWRDSRVVVRDE